MSTEDRRFRVTEHRLKTSWEYVRSVFFPRWDKDNEWRVLVAIDYHWHVLKCYSHFEATAMAGGCDWKRKFVEVAPFLDSKAGLVATLVHEVCHAIAGGHNSKAWKPRMKKAIRDAEKAGKHDVATILRKDIERHDNRKNEPLWL